MRALSLSLALLCLTAHSCAQGWRVGGASASTDAPEAPTVAAIALAIKSRAHSGDGTRYGAIQDSRCYLMNGGAVESFFISEDTPVGSVIGTLSVNGDPSSEHGDITLRLQEKNAAVGIAPGTKNLTLLRTLDREERLGPSNVYVNVRCDRRRTTDPSFIIPVSVRVWDVNDNAPEWVGAPYSAQLSELAARGARVPVAARATDADQPGPHATIHYRVLPGPHSEYITFPNELDSTLVVDKPLDYETLRNLTVTLRAQDGGDPPLHSDTTLTLTVLDADDQNPKFTHEHYTAVVPEDAKEGTVLSPSPGPVSARDQDAGIGAPLQYGATGDSARLVRLRSDTGAVLATQALVDELRQPITVVIKATQIDNSDRYALATLTLSRASEALKVSGVRFRRRHYSANVSESATPGNVILTLHTTPSQKNLQFYVSDRSFLDKFAINSAGEVVLRRALDYESTDLYQYQVMVTDGTSNDTASIDIIVMNVNEWEPRFRHPQYEFRVHERDVLRALQDGGNVAVGVMHVFDGDAGDMVTLSLRGEGADMFHVNSSGALWVSAARLGAANSSALHLVVTAQDSGDPPRQTSVPVTVHLPTSVRQSNGTAPLLGVALGALAILVCALAVYIYAVRRRSKQATSPSNGGYVSHEKSAGEPPSGEAGAAGAAGAARAGGGAGSLLSVSAGASTILADSTSSIDTDTDLPHLHSNGLPRTSASRQGQRVSRSTVAPAPVPAATVAAGPTARPGPPTEMSDHLCGAAGRSGVAWPSATIPARVKKLSWDDTEHAHEWAGTDRRHQPCTRGTLEPHRLLLTHRQLNDNYREEHNINVTHQNEPTTSNNGNGRLPDVTKADAINNNTPKNGSVKVKPTTRVNTTLNKDIEWLEMKNSANHAQYLSDAKSKAVSQRNDKEMLKYLHSMNYGLQNKSLSDTNLNEIGIPVYSNCLPHPSYVNANYPMPPPNYLVPTTSHPLSPSNYPTMIIGHPFPTHGILVENPKLLKKKKHLTISGHESKNRTKHLKPPKNKTLTTRLANQTINYAQSYPMPNYAIPGAPVASMVNPQQIFAANLPNRRPVEAINLVRITPRQIGQIREGNTIPISSPPQETSNRTPQSSPRYVVPPTAPSESPSPLRLSGPPPTYATIDPVKLRNRHVTPGVFKRGFVANNRYDLL